MKAEDVFLIMVVLVTTSLGKVGFAQVRYDLHSKPASLEIIGRTSVNKTGHSIAIGDINGDGKGDLIIGAPGLDSLSRQLEGRVYVFFGAAWIGGQRDLNTESADLEIVGSQPHSGLGTAVISADVNGDQIDDLIMSAPGTTVNNREKVGTVSIIFGKASFPAQMTTSDAEVQIHGEAEFDEFGEALAIGNVNRDDYNDLIVGVPLADLPDISNAGKVFVFHGVIDWSSSIDLSRGTADLTVLGVRENQFMGNAVAAGDLNNDGWDDLIIGNFKANSDVGFIDIGKTYVLFMSDSTQKQIDLAVDDPDITVSGESGQDHLGISVTSGDFNGDGLTDLVVGARRADDGDPVNAGKVYVFENDGAWPGEINLAADTSDITIVGAADVVNLGISLAFGKVDNDDIDDLIIGAPFSSPEARTQSGKLFVFLGRSTFPVKAKFKTDVSDVVVVGAAATHLLGNAVAVGDINGDGQGDIVVAAEDAEPAGRVYVLLGDVLTSIDSPNADFALPETFQLQQNYPNPFNAGTTISLEVPANAGSFEVTVFNVHGQKVNTLFKGAAQPGLMKLHWDGSDASGRAVGSGVYLYSLKSGDSVSIQKKLVLLK